LFLISSGKNPVHLDVSVTAGVLRKFVAHHPSSYREQQDSCIQSVSGRGDLFFYGI